MRTISYKIGDLERVVIGIGYVGENEHTKVQIDCTDVFDQYPNAQAGMVIKPPAGDPYPKAVLIEGNTVVWEVTDSDLATEGSGEMQLNFTENNVIVKSCVSKIRITRSIVGNGPAPEPLQDWLTQAVETLEEADHAIEEVTETLEDLAAIDEIAKSAEASDVGKALSPATVENGVVTEWQYITPGGGTEDYTDLENKPSIAGVELSGNKSLSDLGIASASDLEDVQDDVTDVKNAIQGKPDIKGSNKTGVDLDLSDPDGNVLARFKNGAFFTERFASNPNIITVKKDGTGDFTTLKAATESITDNDPVTNPYEIHIYPGTYDTLEGYTDAEIRAADIGGGYTPDSMVGVKLKDGVSLIGIGNRESIILTAELSTTDYGIGVRGNISTLNLHGNCRIENLTIMAKAIRYCVHDDFQYLKRYTRIVKNCAFIPVGMSLSSNPATTYGSGMREAGCDALFENCDFGSFFGMHTKTGMTGNGIVIFNHCKGLGLRLGDTAAENDVAQHTFHLYDCDFRSVKITRDTATTPHIFVEGVNNKNAMMFCGSADHPHIANVLKTYPTSVPIGTLVTIGAGELTATSGGIRAVAASDIESALGVLVDRDTYFDYIQTDGFIHAKAIGISSGLSVGDYITVDGNMKLIGGGTSANAVGVVKYTDSNDNAQILLLGR